jgi:hypothetical protein
MSTQPMYHGAFGILTAAQTTVVTSDTFVKAAGTTLGINCYGFAHSDNRLKYTGNAGRTFAITANVSMTTSAATEVFLAIFKNGERITPLGGTYPVGAIQRHVGVASDVGAAAVSTLVKLKKDDYVELWLTTDDGAEVTWEFGTLIATVAG